MYNRLLILLIMGLISLTLQAQKLTVESMTLADNDISARQYERKDLNGQACALVKVSLPSLGMKFEGNVIEPVEYKTGEYWVYMSAGSQELRMKHPQTQPLHVIFSDYGIKKVESRNTYNLSIQMPTILQTQKLIINYTPTNAMVLIDSKFYRGNGRVEVTLPVGSHNYIIAAEGYETAEATIKLNATSPRTVTETLVATVQPSTQQSIQEASQQKSEQSITKKVIDVNMLGIDVRPITDSQKKQLEINYGLEVLKVNGGKMKEAGVPKGFILQKVNDKSMYTFDDLQEVVNDAGKSKDQMLIIKGVYPTGKRAGFVVYLHKYIEP